MDAPSVSQQQLTDLLTRWSQGDDAALAELTPLVYKELRRIAHRHMGGQRPDHTLQTTALVNEAYLRLADQTNPSWQNRAHFFAVAARAMRQSKCYDLNERGKSDCREELIRRKSTPRARDSFHALQTPNTRKRDSKSISTVCRSCMDVARRQHKRVVRQQPATRHIDLQCVSLCNHAADSASFALHTATKKCAMTLR
jgi:hypothetical protein